VRLRELFYEAKPTPADDSMEKYGRAFNHPEHLIFFKGSAGALEALSHFKEIATEQPGATTVRGKWDGNPQVYWGRETKGGPLILAGHNQWSRGVKSDSAEGVYDFIANQSGKPKTSDEMKTRQAFAKNFSALYPLFDAATPKDFVGFLYADSLFGVDPGLNKKLIRMDGYPKGVWTFAPNPKSNTRYYVDAQSELGQRIAQAKVMVVGHAMFDTFGAPDRAQQPLDDFSMFNQTPGLIVQGPIYTNSGSGQDTNRVDELVDYVSNEVEGVGPTIDAFISSLPDPDKNGVFYPFFNAMSNLHANNEQSFDSITGDTFLNWMEKKGISKNKQQHIINMIKAHPGAFDGMLKLIKDIRNMKDEVYAAYKSQGKPEIWDSDSEGYVRYAQPHHKYGNIKIVPTTWAPGRTPS
jgi:flavodoxin